jgi:hypothetical protein
MSEKLAVLAVGLTLAMFAMFELSRFVSGLLS